MQYINPSLTRIMTKLVCHLDAVYEALPFQTTIITGKNGTVLEFYNSGVCITAV